MVCQSFKLNKTKDIITKKTILNSTETVPKVPLAPRWQALHLFIVFTVS
jgi:hypothetical protein